jgi:hypothetical protein
MWDNTGSRGELWSGQKTEEGNGKITPLFNVSYYKYIQTCPWGDVY